MSNVRTDPLTPEEIQQGNAGNPVRGTTSLGTDKDTDGSKWIIQVVDRREEPPGAGLLSDALADGDCT